MRFIFYSFLADNKEQLAAKIIEEPHQFLKVSIGADIQLNCSAIGAASPLELQWKMFEKNGLSNMLTQKLDTIITQTFKYKIINKENIKIGKVFHFHFF